MVIVAVLEKYVDIDLEELQNNVDDRIEYLYYKYAVIDKLKDMKSKVILHQRLDCGLELQDIEEVFDNSESIILILQESYRESKYIEELFRKGIYNLLFENDVDYKILVELLNESRDENQAREYFGLEEIDSNQVQITNETALDI